MITYSVYKIVALALRKEKIVGPLLLVLRQASGFRKQLDKQLDRDQVFHEFVGKNTKKTRSMFVWGFAESGALGIKKYLEPPVTSKVNKPVKRFQQYPHRMNIFEKFRQKILNVACGYGFTVYSTESKSSKKHAVFGVGINTDSQLGLQNHRYSQGEFSDDYVISPSKISLPLKDELHTRITHVGCGRAHTVIVTDGEGIFTLGSNALGQCGRPIVVGEIFRRSHIINHIDFNEPVRKLVCGQDHNLLLTMDGRVFSWGLGSDGQTGLGHAEVAPQLTLVQGDISGEAIVDISSRVDCCLAVSERGDMFGWGNSEYQQICSEEDCMQVFLPQHIDVSPVVGRVKNVAAAGSMCALVNADHHVFAWGYGIIGKGPKVVQSKDPLLLPPVLFSAEKKDVFVVKVEPGMFHLSAITNQGDLYVWGRNRGHVLGLGHKEDQYFPFKVHLPAAVQSCHFGVDHAAAICSSFI